MGQSVGETQSTEERGVRPDAICAIFNSGALRRGVIENRKDRIYEAGVGVKQKKKKLCLCRQVGMIAGDKLGDSD